MRARGGIATATIVAAAAALVLCLRHPPFARYVVDGASMEPSFRDGDRLVVWRWAYARRSPIANDVVLLRDPERPGHRLLKRVAAVSGAAIWVLGDNASASRDSRTFGAVSRERIIGKALFTY
jgi:signal peptidase I